MFARGANPEINCADSAPEPQLALASRSVFLLSAQNRILRMVASGEALLRVLDEIIHVMEAESGEALCSVLLLSEDGQTLAWASAPSLPEAYNRDVDRLRVGPQNGSCGTAVFRKHKIVVTDIAHDPLWDSARALALAHGLRACTSVPILDSKGRVLGTFAFYYRAPRVPSERDLTLIELSRDLAGIAIERSRMFTKLEEAVEARDTFLAIASHELKTPLTTLLLQMSAFRHVAQEHDSMPVPEILSKLDKQQRQAGKLQRLIDELLDVTRLVSGRVTVERETVDLREMVREVVARLAEAAPRESSKIEVDAEGPAICMGDRLRLEQVVSNLVSNAFKFGGGKPIKVCVDHKGETARLCVRDHGIGIAPEDQERIFQQFERAVSVRNYGGLGLGLWICRELVERMGGRISVYSKFGEGSTFTVEIPLSQ